MLFEALLPPEDRPYRAAMPDWAIQAAKHMVEEGRQIKGLEGVTEHLRRCGVDVSDRQIYYARDHGWDLLGRRGLPRKFNLEHLAIVIEIAISRPRITQRTLPLEFAIRTGLTIDPSYAWQIATEALRRLPPRKSPVLSVGHRALRELFHQMLFVDLSIYPSIVWSDECSIWINPTTIHSGSKVVCEQKYK